MLFLNENDLKKEKYERINTNYINKSDKFLFKSRDFSKQFAHIYASRLSEMKKILPPKIEQKWGKIHKIKNLYELNEDSPQKCVIIGTLFKHQNLKPSILREISEENQLVPQPIKNNFVDDSDELILEDELQRIRLIGSIDVHYLVTGIVCAVLGYDRYEGCDGKFIAEDVLFYESGPQKPLPTLSTSPLMIIMSGLDWSHEVDFFTSLELFQQWVFGNLESNDDEHDWEAANITRIIIAGNSISTTGSDKNTFSNAHNVFDQNTTLNAVRKLDTFLSDLSKSVNIDLMPGEFDPTNYMLPQQPFHQCMFPKSARYKSFQSVTNPYSFEIDGCCVLGTSGQNAQDILRYSRTESSIEAMKSTIKWSHIFPTGPDTLPCYPYYDEDPFIIDECPHIYFAGNCNEFSSEITKEENGKTIRYVCVPSFSKTQTVAVINLRTLDAFKMSFKVQTFDDVEE